MIQSINTYFNDTQWTSFQDLWFPMLLTFVVILVFTFILLKLVPKKSSSKHPGYLAIFYIHIAFICAALLAATAWVAYACWCWTQHQYGINHREFAHLLCIGVGLIAAVFGYISLRKYYAPETLRGIMPIARTYREAEHHSNVARKGFGKLKFLAPIPFAGLLVLLTLMTPGRNLIVIFLDNSSSMEEGLLRGQQALSQTFNELPENTEVILASFPPKIAGRPAQTVEAVLKKTKPGGGLVVSQEFASPGAADAYLRGISIGDGSPITEAVWDVFLNLKSSRDHASYENRKLLVVTDGNDGYTAETTNKSRKFLCSDPSFDAFFDASDVHMISINNDTGRFFDEAAGCGYDIQDGNSLDSYTAAVDDALGDMTTDWNFIWWIIILLGIAVVGCLMISPARFDIP